MRSTLREYIIRFKRSIQRSEFAHLKVLIDTRGGAIREGSQVREVVAWLNQDTCQQLLTLPCVEAIYMADISWSDK